MQIATARENETLDALVWRVLRQGSGAVEQAMKLNPSFAPAMILPAGAQIILPDMQDIATPTLKTINIWE